MTTLAAAFGPRTLSSITENPRVRWLFDRVALVLFLYFVQQRLWPAPIGILVQGMVIGGLTALTAFGLALVYRANRIINFAQGDAGGAPALLAVLLIVGPGLPYWLTLPIGILAAIALGLLLEFLIIRRFFRAPRLMLTVVTIGLAQILAGSQLLLPRAFGFTIPPQSFPSPFDFSFRIDPVVFRGNDILAIVVVPLVIAGLALFFRRTSIGIAVRASAEHADRASLVGIPVMRIHTIVWILATVLSTIAMLLRGGIVGFPVGSVLGPLILLRALTAAIIGGMERLPTIFVASVGLGIVEQAVVWHTGQATLVDPVMFIVVLLTLLLRQKRRASRAEDASVSTWRAAKEVRDVPRELAKLPEVRWGARGSLFFAVAGLLALPVLLSESALSLVTFVAIYGILGISLVVLTGWAGQVSLGQMGFAGVGGVVAVALTTQLGWDMSIALVLAATAGAAVAVAIGIPTLRIRGLLLAVITLAFAMATSSYLLNPDFIHWLPEGRIERPLLFDRVALDTEVGYYFLTLAVLAFAISALRRIRRSRTGRVLVAVRENERAVQSFGVNATRVRLTAFAISGFLAALAGALLVQSQQQLDVGTFLPGESLRAFTMVVIGGVTSIPGVLLGAAFVRGGVYVLPQELRFLTSGAGLVLVMMLVPGGLGSLLYGLRDTLLRRVAARRGIVVPSLIADTHTDRQLPLAQPRLDASP